MVDIEALKEKWMPKLEAQDLKFGELKEVLELMVGVANENEDFADEYGSFTKTYQFNVSDKPEAEWMWMKVEAGKFSAGMGKLPKYDLQFSMNSQCAADMISGKLDSNSAFIKGDLKIDGQIKDGVKFQGIMALFKDVMDL